MKAKSICYYVDEETEQAIAEHAERHPERSRSWALRDIVRRWQELEAGK